MCNPDNPPRDGSKILKRTRNPRKRFESSPPVKKLVVETTAEIRAKNLVIGKVRILGRHEPSDLVRTNVEPSTTSTEPNRDLPTSFMSTDSDHDVPAASVGPNQEPKATSTDSNKDVGPSFAGLSGLGQEPPAKFNSTPDVPASLAGPDQEPPAIFTDSERDVPASMTKVNGSTTCSSAGSNREEPAGSADVSSTGPNRNIPLFRTGRFHGRIGYFAGSVTTISPPPAALPIPSFL